MRVVGPDAYLCELLAEYPTEVAATVCGIAREKTRPPRTPQDLVEALRGAGLPSFREQLARLL